MPAGTPGYDSLSVLRVDKMMKALSDVRDIQGKYVFLDRTPVVPAEEGEIMARWIDRPQIADLVTDDAKAATYTSGKFTLETTEVPNIKIGRSFTQSQVNTMRRVAAGSAMAEDMEGVKTAMFDIGERNVVSIKQRMENLCIAMRTDRFSYKRGGLVIPALSWGMPVQNNTVAGTPWYANPSTATPIDNMYSILLTQRTIWGEDFDRITMSTAAFRAALSCTEFQNKAKIQLRSDIGYTNLSLFNLDQQKKFMMNVLGIASIELYDQQAWSQDNTGNQSAFPQLAANLVIFENSQYDNNKAIWDFANGVVTESIISSFMGAGMGGVPGMIGEFKGGTRGPTGYATVSPGLNPPKMEVWGVARGFPRKFRLQASAVLDIGPVPNPIPVTEVFGTNPFGG